MVPKGGFEPPTQAFSGPCSTPELPRHCLVLMHYIEKKI
jgi:hypothetical protein